MGNASFVTLFAVAGYRKLGTTIPIAPVVYGPRRRTPTKLVGSVLPFMQCIVLTLQPSTLKKP